MHNIVSRFKLTKLGIVQCTCTGRSLEVIQGVLHDVFHFLPVQEPGAHRRRRRLRPPGVYYLKKYIV